ncbi:hypothetical protein B7494_g2843 [Chlorociboria aeruginascens]|nr:hypothetical protein B7494_g2843 [Chlorociboria aeruginascens]
MMILTTILALTALVEAQSMTMLRFGCSQVVIDRLDPLVNPGLIPSPHVHQIVGGNAFNASIPSTDVSTLASCTTCEFSQDFSNYWTANLYYKARNGTYKRVNQGSAALQFNDNFSTQIGGGTLVYYVSAQPGSITAFKPGFRMLVGDVNQRTANTTLKYQNCYRCYTGPNFGGDVSAPCQSTTIDTQGFPTAPCLGGIRSNVLFPTCWDGVNLDSPNHEDHVAYPVTGPATFLTLGGACPASHPVRIPQVMLEVVWDTTPFNDRSDWPTDGSQPFYLSQGDNTGYGQHADYVFGWEGNSLQSAMNTANCYGASCASLQTQQINNAKSCSISPVVQEDNNGWMTSLPGQDMPVA